ncbi:MAG: stage III sporulation protein AD [Clostridia bacterium]|nr:stage III sporulation protein AD [Clostridia bacterium]
MSGTGLFSVLAIALTAAFGAVALKKYSPEISVVIVVSAGVILLIEILSEITPVLNEMNVWIQKAGIESGYLAVLLKSVGICFVCQFAADSCREAGHASLAAKVELASGITIMILALPLMENILTIASGLLSGQ